MVIMTKDPSTLPVKTRLSATIGEGTTRDLYRTFLLDLLDTVRAAGLRPVVSLCPAGGETAFWTWLGDTPPVVPQSGADMGARILGAIASAMALGPGPVVAVASDVPDLPGEHLAAALDALEGADAVAGPSSDGGFNLLGLRREAMDPAMLDGMPWSTGSAMDFLARTLEARGVSLVTLPPWHDVDDADDLRRLAARLEEEPGSAPRTRALLRELDFHTPEVASPWLSVVVPVLGEADGIEGFLRHTLSTAAPGEMEVIVVDGDPEGSTMKAIDIEGVTGLTSRTGRGTQMNAGARAARGSVLLFLHADTLLPGGAPGMIRRALEGGVSDVGAFDVSYGEDLMVRRMMGKLGNFRSRLRRVPYGEHGVFMTREAFDDLGGFPDVPIMEDVEMMLRVRRSGRDVAFVRPPVTTSTRRFEAVGFWRNNLRNLAMLFMHRLGISPEKLLSFYPPPAEERDRWRWRTYPRGGGDRRPSRR